MHDSHSADSCCLQAGANKWEYMRKAYGARPAQRPLPTVSLQAEAMEAPPAASCPLHQSLLPNAHTSAAAPKSCLPTLVPHGTVLSSPRPQTRAPAPREVAQREAVGPLARLKQQAGQQRKAWGAPPPPK